MSNNYKRTNVKEDTIEFTITIPKENFKESYDTISKDKSKDLDLKGFRKGQVPENMIKENLGDTIKFEVFEKLAPLYVNTSLTKEQIEPIAPPTYKEIPKLEVGEDIEFTVLVTIMPEFKLGNLKKIKVEKQEVKVTEEEIKNSLEELKKGQKTKEKEINDKWAKEVAKILGLEKVEKLDELKKLITDSLKAQKDHIALQGYQDKILKEAIELSKIEIPEPAIKFEASEREKAFSYEMQQRGVDIKDFMKAQNLTIEKMREMWEKDAKDALDTDTLLKLFATEKKVVVSDEELGKKIEDIKKEKGDKENEIYSNPQWKEYIRNVETKQKAFQMLMTEVLGKDWNKKA